MKISTRSSVLMLTATALLAISACGGSDSSSEAAPRTKNAALCTTVKGRTTCTQVQQTVATSPATTSAPATTATTPATTSTTTNLEVNTSAICTAPSTTAPGPVTTYTVVDRAGRVTRVTVKPVAPPATTIDPKCAPTTTTAPTTIAPTTIAPTTTAAPATTAAPLITTAPSTTDKKTCSIIDKKYHRC